MIRDSLRIILVALLVTAFSPLKSAAAVDQVVAPGILSGFVYEDSNDSGEKDEGDSPLTQVRVRLVGTNTVGKRVRLATVTTNDGSFAFRIPPGTYALMQSPSSRPNTGSLGGVASNSVISKIVVCSGSVGRNYNFGEFRGKNFKNGHKYQFVGRGRSDPAAGETPVSSVPEPSTWISGGILGALMALSFLRKLKRS